MGAPRTMMALFVAAELTTDNVTSECIIISLLRPDGARESNADFRDDGDDLTRRHRTESGDG